jgi:anti-sigma regulatory factor (Ser/Thr protein kinase)
VTRDPGALSLELSSDPRLLVLVRGVLRMWMELLGLARDRRDEVVLAVDEACANCMRHAYGGRVDGRVSLQFSADDEWIRISVSDRGTPCPADRATYQPLEAPDAAGLSPGGLGVKLIYRVFDEVRFRPGETRGNCVTMRMRRTATDEVDRED